MLIVVKDIGKSRQFYEKKLQGTCAMEKLTALTGDHSEYLGWVALIRCVDVQAAGPNGTNVGFAAFNLWFHRCECISIAIIRMKSTEKHMYP